MLQRFSKYHGAGNDFLLADNRDGLLSLSASQIQHLCNRHTGFGGDGVMLLESSPAKDFNMVYYNPDGSGGMMCGNGGRCIVAFAADCGAVDPGSKIVFDAADGEHVAFIPESFDGGLRTVRLKMKDVSGIQFYDREKAFFLDTGTRHLVKFITGLSDYPVLEEGATLRHDARFAPVGTNVNFIEPGVEDGSTLLNIRTFEKGVEYETLACGTGIVASAMAAYSFGIPASSSDGDSLRYDVRAAIARLAVDFVPSGEGASFGAKDVWLTGPAQFVGMIEVEL